MPQKVRKVRFALPLEPLFLKIVFTVLPSEIEPSSKRIGLVDFLQPMGFQFTPTDASK